MGQTITNTAQVTAPRDYCNPAIFQQDKGLLISQRERQALPFGTLRGWINAALISRLRDYPNYSAAWDLMQVRIPSLPPPLSLSFSFRNPPSKYPLQLPDFRMLGKSTWLRSARDAASRKHLSTN